MARLSDPYALLVCLHCAEDDGDVLVMPFGPAAGVPGTRRMRDWWTAHREGTGHTWGWCNRDGENPPPGVAEQEARAYMEQTRLLAPPRNRRPDTQQEAP